MLGAGDLRDRITFQKRGEDENGDPLGGWDDQFTRSARLTWLRGSEGVMASRLEGKQPVVITVRACSQTRLIDGSWRAVNARDDRQKFNITAASPAKERGFIDILAVMGGATG